MNYYSETIFNIVWNLENILKKDPDYTISPNDVEMLDKASKIIHNVIKQLKERNS
ncbi:MAG: hypothetical protein RL736_297 [Pseudomonadota bacterium]|jgi:hypothetical protein